MKTKFIFPIGLAAILIFIATTASMAILMNVEPGIWQGAQTEDKDEMSIRTGSPYFLVISEDFNPDQFPLKSTSAKVNIAGVIADVTVTQEYANNGNKTLEAIYVFPASTRAAVYGLKMQVGERTITARTREREKARSEYENAKANGQSATLLEEERPNVFRMNVANIMPGDIIKVELKYTELLVPERGTYRFIYPTVVGPRYQSGNGLETGRREQWATNPYLHEGVPPTYKFGFTCSLNAGMAITGINCSTHKMITQYTGTDKAEIHLEAGETFSANKDLVLEYRLRDNKIATGLLLYPGENENFFLAMIQPPKRVTPGDLPPREYVFILDVSGSMHGYPINISKKLMRDLVGGLRSTDRFNVLLFAGGNSLFSEKSVPATSENLERAMHFIDKEEGSGGTELLPALQRALKLEGSANFSRSFVIATDGYVTVEKEAFNLIRHNLNQANFFPFGIGTSVNHFLIEGLAKAGGGVPFVITEPSQAHEQAEKFRQYINSPVLSHIQMECKGFTTYDMEPLSIPDVLDERPVIIFGKYRGEPKGTLIFKGVSAQGKFEQVIDLKNYRPVDDNKALQYLWARERIRNLDDFGEADSRVKEQVTELGLRYNLLTQYTSFIAIDSEIRNHGGTPVTIQQSLPLPEGVSDYAVGGGGFTGNALPAMKNTRVVAGISTASEKEVKEDTSEGDNVYSIAETMPGFPGGEQAYRNYLHKNLVYPAFAKNAGIQGKVWLIFTVTEDGKIRDVKILKGIGGGCDEEAVRLIQMMPVWTPGTQNGNPVSVSMKLQVEFVL